jgi:hypothetical protein
MLNDYGNSPRKNKMLNNLTLYEIKEEECFYIKYS